MNKLYTIGYSIHSTDSFLSLIKKYLIDVVVDVRSAPYSKFKPEFNQKFLKSLLNNNNIKYVFLGKECGARYDDPSCYVNGKAEYNLISKHDNFLNGIHRIKDGLGNFNIVLLCAEKDPINCHRMILICRALKKFEIDIFHIIDNEKVETHSEAERRLLKFYGLDQTELFRSANEQLEQAYDLHGKKIAYNLIANTSDNSLEDN